MIAEPLFKVEGASPALCDPLIKYAGSKRWLVGLLTVRLHAHLSAVDGMFVETFAGSLALGLSLGWARSVYSDTNADLVNLYQVTAEDPAGLCLELDGLRSVEGEERYYAIRESIWPENRARISRSAWAARTVWLNKHGYNGLMRYNGKTGRFNVPWGRRKNVSLPSQQHVERVSRLLRPASVRQTDFAFVLDEALRSFDPRRLVIYLDPPYGGELLDVSPRGPERRQGKVSKVFTGYTGSFTWEDQKRLAEWAKALALRGALVIASNSWTEEICDLYRDGFSLFQIGVRHSVGATGARRGRRAEMLAVSSAHAGVLDSIPVKIGRKIGG